jgi:hypothetical protein
VELVAILHLLWNHRVIVALGVVLALAAGLLAGSHGSPGRTTGVGTVRLLLDTTDSQLVKNDPKEADTLPRRAGLLADLLATDEGKAMLARSAGVPEEQLVILGPSARLEPQLRSPLVTRAFAAASVADAPFVVNVLASERWPIVSIEAYADNARRAGNLAEAAAASLQSLLVAADATHSRGFVLDVVAPLRSTQETIPSGRRRVMFIAAVATFSLWCGCVVFVAGTARKRRRVRTRGVMRVAGAGGGAG